MIRRIFQSETEQGASLVEYTLLIGLIALVCIGAVTALGNQADEPFKAVTSSLAVP